MSLAGSITVALDSGCTFYLRDIGGDQVLGPSPDRWVPRGKTFTSLAIYRVLHITYPLLLTRSVRMPSVQNEVIWNVWHEISWSLDEDRRKYVVAVVAHGGENFAQ